MRRLRFWVVLLALMLAVPFLMAQVSTYRIERLGGGTSGKLAEVSSTGSLLMTTSGTASASADPGFLSFPRFRLAGGATGNLAEVDSTGHLLVSFDTTTAQSAISLTLTDTTGNCLAVDTTTLVVDCLNHRVGLGKVPTNTGTLDLAATYTDPTGTSNAGTATSTTTLTGNNAQVVRGLKVESILNQAGSNSTSTQGTRGLEGVATVNGSSGTATGILGLRSVVQNTGAGTVTDGYGLLVAQVNSGGGTFGTYTGALISAASNVSIARGLRSQIAAGTNMWNLYLDGTAQNSLAGNLGIGFVTAPTNLLSLDGQSARTVWMERNTTANTAGLALTVQAGGATSAATDKAGGTLNLTPGASTGTGRSLASVQGYVPADSTGTGDGTVVDREIVGAYKALTNNSATSIVNLTLASNTVAAVMVRYAVQVFNATDVQVEEGILSCHSTNKAGAIANNTCVKSANQQAVTSGTLTVTGTITAASPAVVQINANSSLTPSSGYPRLTYTLDNLTSQSVSIQ